MKRVKLNLSLTVQQNEKIKKLVDNGLYRTRQEIILEAIRNFFSDYNDEEKIDS